MAGSQKNLQPLPFEFITITDSPGSAKYKHSHAIRSQAMQSFLHAKRDHLPESKPLATPPKVQPKSLKASSTRFKLSTWSRKSAKKSKTVIDTDGGDGHHDPSQYETSIYFADRNMMLPASLMFNPSGIIRDSLDEYNVLPIPASRQIRELLYHCKRQISSY